jgi:hypothetical protein
MPLSTEAIADVISYCDKHLADRGWFDEQFDFIADQKLAKRLALEFYAARYIYKLGEALAVDGEKLHAHVKFQITQYASIYEAVIVHLLWSRFVEHEAVKKISSHMTYKPHGKLPVDVRRTSHPDQQLHICALGSEPTTVHAIKFDDKIQAAVEVGFLHETLGEEVSEFFRLRNGIHIEAAVSKQIQYELEQAHLAYRRMQPFIAGVKEFLKNGKKPKLKLARPS